MSLIFSKIIYHLLPMTCRFPLTNSPIFQSRLSCTYIRYDHMIKTLVYQQVVLERSSCQHIPQHFPPCTSASRVSLGHVPGISVPIALSWFMNVWKQPTSKMIPFKMLLLYSIETSLFERLHFIAKLQRNSNVDRIQVVFPECTCIMSKYTMEDCPGPKKEFVSCLVG